MGFSFEGIKNELASEKFRLLYLQMQVENPSILTFQNFPALISFFRKRTSDYEREDAIMRCMVIHYQKGGPYEILSSVFLILYLPTVGALFNMGQRACWQVPDEDISQEISILLLQSIKESDPTLPNVSSRFTGALKNKFQKFIKEKVDQAQRETAYDDEFKVSAHDEKNDYQTKNSVEEYDLTKFRLQLDELLRKRKITKKDKRLLIATIIDGKVLKKIVPKHEYEKYKARLRRFKKANKKLFAKLLI